MQKSFGKIIGVILVILTVVYFGTILCLKNAGSVKTELAVLDSLSDSIHVKGIVLRKETEIFNESSGVLNFLLNDGEKVNKGGLIAEVYRSEQDALFQKDIKRLKKEIATLENFEAAKKTLAISPNYIEKQSYQQLKNFAINLNSDNYQELTKNKNHILNLLNERQAVLGKFEGISDKIRSLKAERDKLSSCVTKKCANIISSESGYFMGTVDGFENLISMEDALKLKPDTLTDLLGRTPNKSSALAKIVNLSYWYFACNVSNDQALKFHVDDYVELVLPFSNIKKVPAKVVAVNQERKSADATLILRCNNIDKDILNLRFEDVKINIKDYDGIRINKAAIHENEVIKTITDENGNQNETKKRVLGVYVVNGRQMIFKEIDLLYAGDTHVICRNPSAGGGLGDTNTLKIYDEVVIEGCGLYNKKVVK